MRPPLDPVSWPRGSQLLWLHAKHGAQWHEPGWHSGYNEVIVSSGNHNAQLPHAIEAFFYIRGQRDAPTDLGYGNVIRTAEAHRAFLAEYGLRAADVPLLEFDPTRWEQPFLDVAAA